MSQMFEIDAAMLDRAAKALFADNYVDSPQRGAIVESHWAHVSEGVREAYRGKAQDVLVAASEDPYA